MASDAVRETLENPELGFTGLHVAAAVGDTLSVEDTLVLGASIRCATPPGRPAFRRCGHLLAPRRRKHRRHGRTGNGRGAGHPVPRGRRLACPRVVALAATSPSSTTPPPSSSRRTRPARRTSPSSWQTTTAAASSSCSSRVRSPIAPPSRRLWNAAWGGRRQAGGSLWRRLPRG